MTALLYGSSALTTARVVADAVFEYSSALAAHGRADVVRVPVIHRGLRGHARLIVGQAIPLAVVESDEDASFSDAEEVADDVRHRTHRIPGHNGPPHLTAVLTPIAGRRGHPAEEVEAELLDLDWTL